MRQCNIQIMVKKFLAKIALFFKRLGFISRLIGILVIGYLVFVTK